MAALNVDEGKKKNILYVGKMDGYTIVQNRKEHSKNSHLMIDFPTSLGVSERANEQANEQTSKWPSTYVWNLGCSGP